jgi:hypothetical protein
MCSSVKPVDPTVDAYLDVCALSFDTRSFRHADVRPWVHKTQDTAAADRLTAVSVIIGIKLARRQTFRDSRSRRAEKSPAAAPPMTIGGLSLSPAILIKLLRGERLRNSF